MATKIYWSLGSLKEIVKVRQTDKVVLATSAKLRKKLGWAIKEIEKMALPGFKIIIIPDGEKAKSWNALKRLLVKFTRLQLTRKSLVVAFGGGSTTDFVGFASAIYKRGIAAYVNIPTTFLAQVDASTGGKTAIDFEGHKNLVGCFNDPLATIMVVKFFESLDSEQFLDGMVEIAKHGIIKDISILDIIESHSLAELRANGRLLEELVQKSINVKDYFVSQDHDDNGIRQALNLGHAFAHALEIKYGLSHGRAVLIGIIKELRAVESLGINTSEAVSFMGRLFKRFGVSFNPRQFVVDKKSFLQDKKISGEEITIPIVTKIGEVELIKIELDRLIAAAKSCN